MSKNFREDKNNIEYDLYEPCKRKKFKKDNQLSIKNMKALGEELINFTEYSPKLKNLKARQKQEFEQKQNQLGENEEKEVREKLMNFINEILNIYKLQKKSLEASLSPQFFQKLFKRTKEQFMEEEGIQESDAVRRNSQRQVNRQTNKVLQLDLSRKESEKNLNGLQQILNRDQELKKKVKTQIKDVEEFIFLYFAEIGESIIHRSKDKLVKQKLQIIDILRLRKRLLKEDYNVQSKQVEKRCAQIKVSRSKSIEQDEISLEIQQQLLEVQQQFVQQMRDNEIRQKEQSFFPNDGNCFCPMCKEVQDNDYQQGQSQGHLF